MKNGVILSVGIVMGILCIVSIYAVVDWMTPEQEYKAIFNKNTRVLAPVVPAKANFAGEEAPLSLYYVRESFDREIMAATFMHSSTIQMFKRANRWFPILVPILKKHGIPDDFKFLAVAESNLANVVSPAGAQGYWQFMKATGQKYGLEINEFVDERYHVQKATEAACRYLNDAHRKFNNWTLAAASYNRGMEGMETALENQKVASYYDLFLHEETSRYVYRILAIKEVYNCPVQYGFYLLPQDLYPPVPTHPVTVDTAIGDLPGFALKLGINYRILRELNPWIRDYSLPNKSGKVYTFLVPLKGAIDMENLLKKVPVSATFFHDTLQLKEIN